MSATLKNRLPQIIAELPVRVDAAIVRGAQIVAQDAERRLEPHRLSGELEGQIHVDESQRDGVYVLAGDPKDPSFAFWGHMVEHGTTHSRPFPFLVPALTDSEDTIVHLVSESIRGI